MTSYSDQFICACQAFTHSRINTFFYMWFLCDCSNNDDDPIQTRTNDEMVSKKRKVMSEGLNDKISYQDFIEECTYVQRTSPSAFYRRIDISFHYSCSTCNENRKYWQPTITTMDNVNNTIVSHSLFRDNSFLGNKILYSYLRDIGEQTRKSGINISWLTKKIHKRPSNLHRKRYQYFYTHIWDNPWLDSSTKELWMSRFCTIQKQYNILNRFILRWKWKHSTVASENDLYLNYLDPNKSYVITFLQKKSQFRFSVKDLMMMIQRSLCDYDRDFDITVKNPKNPYTKTVFQACHMYQLYFHIKLYTNMKMPELFEKWYQYGFCVHKLVEQEDGFLRKCAIKHYLSHVDESDSYFMEHIFDMLKEHALCNRTLKIHSDFPNSELIKALKPYSYLYYLQYYGELDSDMMHVCEHELRIALNRFVRYNPVYGCKKTSAITILNKSHNIKPTVFHNDRNRNRNRNHSSRRINRVTQNRRIPRRSITTNGNNHVGYDLTESNLTQLEQFVFGDVSGGLGELNDLSSNIIPMTTVEEVSRETSSLHSSAAASDESFTGESALASESESALASESASSIIVEESTESTNKWNFTKTVGTWDSPFPRTKIPVSEEFFTKTIPYAQSTTF